MVDVEARTGGRKRGLVALVVLLVVVAGVTVAGVLAARGSDGGTDAGTDHRTVHGTDWNAVVGVDFESSEIVLYDEQGEELERIDPGFDPLLSTEARGSYIIATGDEDNAAIIDVDDGKTVWEDDRLEDLPRWLEGTTAPVAVLGPPEGGDLTVIDAMTGTVIDLADEAGLDEPRFIPSRAIVSPDGSVLAVSDLVEEVSVVADLAAGTASEAVGRVSAVADDGVVLVDRDEGAETPQLVIRFVGADGEGRGSVPLPPAALPTGLMFTDDSTVVGVATEAEGITVFRAAAGDDETTELAELDIDSVDRAVALTEPERFVVTSFGGETLVVDPEGEEVGSYSGELAPVSVDAHRAECVSIVDGETLRIIDVESGEELAHTEEAVSYRASADGCAVGGTGILVSVDGAVDLEPGTLSFVAPDGRSALVIDGEGHTLVDLTDADADPVTIDAPSLGGFVER